MTLQECGRSSFKLTMVARICLNISKNLKYFFFAQYLFQTILSPLFFFCEIFSDTCTFFARPAKKVQKYCNSKICTESVSDHSRQIFSWVDKFIHATIVSMKLDLPHSCNVMLERSTCTKEMFKKSEIFFLYRIQQKKICTEYVSDDSKHLIFFLWIFFPTLVFLQILAILVHIFKKSKIFFFFIEYVSDHSKHIIFSCEFFFRHFFANFGHFGPHFQSSCSPLKTCLGTFCLTRHPS